MAVFIAYGPHVHDGMTAVECAFPMSKTRFRQLTRTLPGEVSLWQGPRMFVTPDKAMGMNVTHTTTYRNEMQGEYDLATIERRVCYFSDPDAAFHFRLLV